MKISENTLHRLLRAAGPSSASDAAMPFAFDTRVLAIVRAQQGSNFVSILLRRTVLVATVVLSLASAGLIASAVSEDETSAAYAMADNAIEQHLKP